MKLDYRWVGLLVIALAVGHWSGRTSNSSAAEPESSAAELHDIEGDRFRKNPSTRLGKRRDRNSNHGSRSRQQDLDRILADFYDESYGSEDPFGGNGLRITKEHPAWARLCAWAMSLPRSDFPDVMRKAGMVGEQMNHEIVNVLIQRWVELDPDSAQAWVKALQKEDEDEERVYNMEMFLVQEAALHHPQWAAEALKVLHKNIANYNAEHDPEEEFDPLGDSGIYMDLDRFFWRLTTLPAAQRDSIVNYLGNDILQDGMEGWMRGMMVRGSEQDLVKLYQASAESDNTYGFSEAFRRIANEDWKAARDFVETNAAYDVDDVVWQNWPEDDSQSANRWYLDRSTDQDNRLYRIASLARTIKDLNQRQQWINQMEARGEPVSRALEGLVDTIAQDDQLDAAIALIPRLPQEKQQEVRIEIYDRALRKDWFNPLSGESAYFVVLKKEHIQFSRSHPGFREYVLKTNEDALRQFTQLVASVEGEMNGDAPDIRGDE